MASQVCLATTTFDLTAPQQMLRMRSKYAEMALPTAYIISGFTVHFDGQWMTALMRCGATLISCHFRDCKALLFTSLTRASTSSATTNVHTFTRPLASPAVSHSSRVLISFNLHTYLLR